MVAASVSDRNSPLQIQEKENQMKNLTIKVISILALAACFVGAAKQSLAADIRGKITHISVYDQRDLYASVRIEGLREADTSLDKAVARVMLKTKLFKIDAGRRVEADWGEFKVGQTVGATFTGPIAESYPVQGTVAEIVILAQAAVEKPAEPKTENPTGPLREGEIVTVLGVLRGGGMAIGGETTGWMLSYKTSQGMQHVEVDIGGLNAETLTAKSVRITAKVITRNYVERGPTLILKAEKIDLTNP